MPPRMEPYIAQFEANLFSWMDAATLAEFERLDAAREAGDSIAGCNAFWQLFIRSYVADREQPPAFRGGPCDVALAALLNTGVVYEATIGSLGAWEWRPQLAAIGMPALVIHGENDSIPLESAREWAGSLPNATLVVIASSGHFPFVEQRPVFFEAVQKFLGETTPR
jgi:pimeloyl-ACP methyl ester carboxylesterase